MFHQSMTVYGLRILELLNKQARGFFPPRRPVKRLGFQCLFGFFPSCETFQVICVKPMRMMVPKINSHF